MGLVRGVRVVIGTLIKVVVLIVTPALPVWLGARVARVPRVSVWRAWAAAGLGSLVSLLVWLVWFVCLLLAMIHPAYAVVASVLCAGLWLTLQLLVFKAVLRTDWRRAALTWVFTLVIVVAEVALVEGIGIVSGADSWPQVRRLRDRASDLRPVHANKPRPALGRSRQSGRR